MGRFPLGLAAAFFSVGMLVSPSKERIYDSISTRELLLREATGRILARMSTDGGTASIDFLDKEGRARAVLSMYGDSGSLTLSGKAGTISFRTHPLPEITVLGGTGGGRIRLALTDSAGSPEIAVQDSLDRTRGRLALDSHGTARFALAMDKQLAHDIPVMHEVLDLAVTADGVASIEVRSEAASKESIPDFRFGVNRAGKAGLMGRPEVLEVVRESLW